MILTLFVATLWNTAATVSYNDSPDIDGIYPLRFPDTITKIYVGESTTETGSTTCTYSPYTYWSCESNKAPKTELNLAVVGTTTSDLSNCVKEANTKNSALLITCYVLPSQKKTYSPHYPYPHQVK